jgi:hypothetical protein
MFVHTVGVETFEGETSKGDKFAASVSVKGLIQENQAVKVDGISVELTSGDAGGETKLYTHLKHADLFKPKSRVTLPYRTARVFKIRYQYGGPSLGTPDHIEVLLV